jgi:hypothetical protein
MKRGHSMLGLLARPSSQGGKRTRAARLRGFITERDFLLAEAAFPGITDFYAHCRLRPHTFLELVWKFENRVPRRHHGRLRG